MKKRAAEPAEPSDGELLRRIREGSDEAAVKEFKRRHTLGLKRIFDASPLREHSADLIQEIWKKAFAEKKLTVLKGSASAKPWLLAVATNLLVDKLRSLETRQAVNAAVPITKTGEPLDQDVKDARLSYLELRIQIERYTGLLALVLDRRNAPHESTAFLLANGSKRFEKFVSEHWEAKLFALSAKSRDEYSEQPGASHKVVELFSAFDHGLAEPVARRVPRFKTYPGLQGMHESETGGTCPRHYHQKQPPAKQVEHWCRTLCARILPAALGYLEHSRLKSAGAAQ